MVHLASANQSVEEQRARRVLADTNLTCPGLVAALTARVADLHIDEQRTFICKSLHVVLSGVGLPSSYSGLSVSVSWELSRRQGLMAKYQACASAIQLLLHKAVRRDREGFDGIVRCIA